MKRTLDVSIAAALIGAVTVEAASSPSLVAHWKFDELGGSIAQDATGRYHGQLSATGAAFVSNGVSGNAIRFDRNQNGYVQAPHLPGVLNDDFSLGVWARVGPDDGPAAMTLVGQHRAWFANGFVIQVNTTEGGADGSRARLLVNTGSYGLTSTTPVNDGQWHHLAVVYAKTGGTRLYVDGAPAEAELASIPIDVDPAVPFLIGGLYGILTADVASGWFSGLVDDIQVYHGALTDSQVTTLFEGPGKALSELEHPVLISPNGGTFVDSIRVTITSNTPGARIVYTLDGREPVAASAEYTGPLALTASGVVRARLFVGEFPASEIVSATFTKVPAVTFDPASGLFTNSVAVTIQNHQGLGTVMYTLDGTDPTIASTPYLAPVLLTTAATIRARLFVNNFPVSDFFSATYTRVYALDDGVDNAWRERYFGPGYLTDPRVAADADPDGDGWSNRLEYQAGTIPTDPASRPAIQAGIRAVPMVTWNSIPGLRYRVLRKPAVNAPAWEAVLEAFEATEAVSSFLDPGAPVTAIYQIERVP